MFTGIIESTGTINAITKTGGDVRLSINTGNLDMSDVSLGDSIAVNGVCLTAVEFDQSYFVADVSNETLNLTTLGNLSTGSEVNLEKALSLSTRLGGHLVSGHVDGIGHLVSAHQESRSIRLEFEAPENIKRYIATKGSVCIDGTSLTVNQVNDRRFGINIVPHTQERTIIKHYKPGVAVNLEVDLIARYVERLLVSGDSGEGVSKELLAKAGFLK